LTKRKVLLKLKKISKKGGGRKERDESKKWVREIWEIKKIPFPEGKFLNLSST